jgi:hypothetical protein
MEEEMARAPSRTFGAANGRQSTETAESAAIREHGACMTKVAHGLERIAKAIENANDLKEKQGEAWRHMIRKYGPWLLGSIPIIASAIGGIAPNLAEAIGHVVAAAPK